MTSTSIELLLTALAAMLSPTTLTFSLLALLLGDRPLRTGVWFYAGALGATLAVGVLAAAILGDVAASAEGAPPKTWVCVLDIVLGVLLLGYVVRAARRPRDPQRTQAMIERMGGLASSPVIAIVAAGATLANPGGFIPIALKDISQLNPDFGEFVGLWVAFALISLLPLLLALIALALAPERTQPLLHAARGWLEEHARTIAIVIIVALAAALLRNGIVGLTS
jgi:hypothetical protein